jgi:hypothetical protein
LYDEVLPIAQALARLLQPHAKRLNIAGSLRRQKSEVSDIELVAIPTPALLPAVDDLLRAGVVQKAHAWGSKFRAMVYQGVRVDLFMADEDNWGYIYWLRTGPGDANTHVVSMLNQRSAPFGVRDGHVYAGGLRTQDKGKWTYSGGQRLTLPEERDWFALLGMAQIAPHERSLAAYRAAWGAKPAWGDPTPYMAQQTPQSAPQQRALPGLNAAYNDVYHAKDVGRGPALNLDTPWERPFLRKDGRVWVRVGCDFLLLNQSDPRAQRYKRSSLTGIFGPGSESLRLFDWLHETLALMIDVVDDAAQILGGDA